MRATAASLLKPNREGNPYLQRPLDMQRRMNGIFIDSASAAQYGITVANRPPNRHRRCHHACHHSSPPLALPVDSIGASHRPPGQFAQSVTPVAIRHGYTTPAAQSSWMSSGRTWADQARSRRLHPTSARSSDKNKYRGHYRPRLKRQELTSIRSPATSSRPRSSAASKRHPRLTIRRPFRCARSVMSYTRCVTARSPRARRA